MFRQTKIFGRKCLLTGAIIGATYIGSAFAINTYINHISNVSEMRRIIFDTQLTIIRELETTIKICNIPKIEVDTFISRIFRLGDDAKNTKSDKKLTEIYSELYRICETLQKGNMRILNQNMNQ